MNTLFKNKIFLLSLIFIVFNAYKSYLNAQENIGLEHKITENTDTNFTNFTNLPDFIINKSDSISEGYFFIATTAETGTPYLLIIDEYGIPVFIKELHDSGYDFKVNKNGKITYFDKYNDKFYVLDSNFNVCDSAKMLNNYITDFHDFLITPDERYFLIGQDIRSVGMDTVIEGGHPNATVVGLIIQELDQDKNLIFQWESWDHYKITDTYSKLDNQYIDYVHANSIEIDEEGDLLISACYMEEVTKIDRETGQIIWRLGGKNNEFNFINDEEGFSHQHSAYYTETGTLLLFDNGNLKDIQYSRGVEYNIDEENKTIQLKHTFQNIPDVYSYWMGNIQSLDNANKVIGWGANPRHLLLTEFDSVGNPLYELSSEQNVESYRAFKFPWKTTLFESNVNKLKFDTVNYENSKTLTLSVINNSNEDLEISSYSNLTDNFYIISEFPLIIPSGSFAHLDVVFEPSNKGGFYEDILTINSDGISEVNLPQRIAIQIKLEGFSPDNYPPTVETYPLENSDEIPIDTSFYVKFSEPVRFINGNPVNEENLKNIIKLKKNDIYGHEISYEAEYDSINLLYQLIPVEYLESNAKYCIVIESSLEDLSENRMDFLSVCFYTEINTYTDNQINSSSIIYPNPSNGIVNVFFKEKVTNVIVYDINGIQIYFDNNISNPEYRLDLLNQKNGLYILKIVYTDFIEYYKIVKR